MQTCTSGCATPGYLTLMAGTSLRDSAPSDIKTITNVARILVQVAADVFGVMEQRERQR